MAKVTKNTIKQSFIDQLVNWKIRVNNIKERSV